MSATRLVHVACKPVQPSGLSPRPSQHLPPEAYAPPLAHAPAKSGATYTSLWWV